MVPVDVDLKKISRYRKQSFQLLRDALNQIRGGHWTRSEDLLWGSLTLAVKGVALSRGSDLKEDEAIRNFAQELGNEQRDRRIREAFSQLSAYGDSVERLRESRFRINRIVPVLEDLSGTIERLWELVPRDDVEGDAGPSSRETPPETSEQTHAETKPNAKPKTTDEDAEQAEE